MFPFQKNLTFFFCFIKLLTECYFSPLNSACCLRQNIILRYKSKFCGIIFRENVNPLIFSSKYFLCRRAFYFHLILRMKVYDKIIPLLTVSLWKSFSKIFLIVAQKDFQPTFICFPYLFFCFFKRNNNTLKKYSFHKSIVVEFMVHQSKQSLYRYKRMKIKPI